MTCKYCKNTIPNGSIYCNWCGCRQVREQTKKNQTKVPKARQLPSGRWNIQLRREGISITEDTAALAHARAVAARAGFIAHEKQNTRSITLGEAVDNYIQSRSNLLSPSTVKAYKAIRRNRFTALMDTSLKDITPRILQNAINQEVLSVCNPSGRDGKKINDRAVSNKTVVNAYGLIRRVLAIETSMDLSGIVLPQCGLEGGKTLSPGDIGQLIRAVQGDSIEIPVLLSVWLGLRRSEIAALQRSDFDFDRGTVSIHSALVQNEDNDWVEKCTKTRTSRRTITCPEYILSRVDKLPQGRILTMHPNSLYVRLQKICQRNGLPLLRFHDLRHCAASVMLLLGIPDKYAMERGGWATKRTMTGRYQHTMEDESKNIATTIDQYYLSLINENFTNEITDISQTSA